MKEKLKLTDEVSWVHTDKNGKIINTYTSKPSRLHKLLVKLHLHKPNCLTKYGFAIIAGLMVADVGETAFDYMGIGTGTTAASVNDAALETPKGVRQGTTGTRVTTGGGQTNDTGQWVAVFSQAIDATLTGTDQITEVVVCNAASGNDKTLMRQVFTAEPMNWNNGDILTVTVKVQCKQGS